MKSHRVRFLGKAKILGLLQTLARVPDGMNRMRVLVKQRRGRLRGLNAAFRWLGQERVGRE